MLLEAQGRNTQGNAAFIKAALHSLGIRRMLLVTWHLRRAVALFARAGFEVVPVGQIIGRSAPVGIWSAGCQVSVRWRRAGWR